jgi:hypothetical protein
MDWGSSMYSVGKCGSQGMLIIDLLVGNMRKDPIDGHKEK